MPGAVVALTPAEYLDWARAKIHDKDGVRLPPPWQPGQHWAKVGKTREGKTNDAVWLTSELRRYVMALDPKGHDKTLSASGWPRVTTVPGGHARPKVGSDEWRLWRKLERDRAEGRPVRVIVGMRTRTREQDQANRILMGDAIEYARQTGGWTMIVDEHQILSDRRMYGLGEDIARQAISAATDKMSVMCLMQFLAWVEKAGVRQATLVTTWRTRDRDLVKLIASTVGRPWQEIAAAVDELPKYWTLTISDELRSPMLLCKPPKIG